MPSASLAESGKHPRIQATKNLWARPISGGYRRVLRGSELVKCSAQKEWHSGRPEGRGLWTRKRGGSAIGKGGDLF